MLDEEPKRDPAMPAGDDMPAPGPCVLGAAQPPGFLRRIMTVWIDACIDGIILMGVAQYPTAEGMDVIRRAADRDTSGRAKSRVRSISKPFDEIGPLPRQPCGRRHRLPRFSIKHTETRDNTRTSIRMQQPVMARIGEMAVEKPDAFDPYADRVSARIDRLPATRHIWWLVALVSFGAFFEIYDILLSAPLSVALVAEGIFKTGRAGQIGLSDQALFLAATFGGLYIGTLMFSTAADRLGRRLVFTVALLWYAVATAVMGAQHTALAIDLWRFVASVGIGLELVTIDCYLTELVPAHVQGRAFAFSAGIQFLSSPVVAILAWLLVPGRHFGIDGWRWLTFVPAIGAILIWWVRRNLPESPRWLAVRGRHAEAEIVLADIERHVSADLGHDVPPPRQTPRSTFAAPAGPAPRLFDAVHRRGTIVLIVFHLFQAIGYFGFSNWLPTLLVSQGVTISKSLGYTAIIAIIPPASSFLFMLFADRLDRKWLVVSGAVVAAGFGLLLARTTQSSTFLEYAVAGSGTAVGLSLMSFAYHSYQSRIFPTEIRARGVGVVYSFSRFSTIVSGYLIAFVLQRFGSGSVFLLISGAMTVVALVIGLFGPGTRAALPHVDQSAVFTP